jgi:hypothetical protein
MKRRWLLGIGSLLAVGMLGLGAWLLTRPLSQVTQENFTLIHDGMTKAEVESILGKPNICEVSDETMRGEALIAMAMLGWNKKWPSPEVKDTFEIAIWIAGDRHFVVSLSDDYKVNDTTTYTVPIPTLTERIRSWFGL